MFYSKVLLTILHTMYFQILKVCFVKKEDKSLKCIVSPLHYAFFIFSPFSFT